jgi:hypothetical protein
MSTMMGKTMSSISEHQFPIGTIVTLLVEDNDEDYYDGTNRRAKHINPDRNYGYFINEEIESINE